jgi:hypothetical protein
MTDRATERRMQRLEDKVAELSAMLNNLPSRWTRPKASGGASGFWAIITARRKMVTHDPGCFCEDQDDPLCINMPSGLRLHPYVFWYGFVEATFTSRCLNNMGQPQPTNICDAEGNSLMTRSVIVEAVQDGRIGVTSWPEDGSPDSQMPAVNAHAVIGSNSGPGGTNHHALPPRDPVTCLEALSGAISPVGFSDVNSFHYGEAFDPIPPGAIAANSAYQFNYPVWIEQRTDRNGKSIRLMVAPWTHAGSCSV